MPKCCSATTTASPPRRSRRSKASAAKLGARTKVLYARGSDIAANMPSFEVIPASALFTANGPTEPGLNGEYFNTAISTASGIARAN